MCVLPFPSIVVLLPCLRCPLTETPGTCSHSFPLQSVLYLQLKGTFTWQTFGFRLLPVAYKVHHNLVPAYFLGKPLPFSHPPLPTHLSGLPSLGVWNASRSHLWAFALAVCPVWDALFVLLSPYLSHSYPSDSIQTWLPGEVGPEQPPFWNLYIIFHILLYFVLISLIRFIILGQLGPTFVCSPPQGTVCTVYDAQ